MDIMVKDDSVVEMMMTKCGRLRQTEDMSATGNPLVLVLLLFSSVNILMILSWQGYILCRAVRTRPSRRHLFLSQSLLLGLLLGSALGFAFAFDASSVSCVVVRLGTGLAYTIIYSSLLVKQVFLISLNTGVYLPAAYQALLFTFSVLVQVVGGVEWLVLVPPCQYQTEGVIASCTYCFFLLIFITTISFTFRNIKDNFHESFYICIVMIFSIIMWVAMIITLSIIPDTEHNLCLGK